jgi:hypothetical protein
MLPLLAVAAITGVMVARLCECDSEQCARWN